MEGSRHLTFTSNRAPNAFISPRKYCSFQCSIKAGRDIWWGLSGELGWEKDFSINFNAVSILYKSECNYTEDLLEKSQPAPAPAKVGKWHFSVQVDSSVLSKDIPICLLTLRLCSPSQLAQAGLCPLWLLGTGEGTLWPLPTALIAVYCPIWNWPWWFGMALNRLGAQDQPFPTFSTPWLSFALCWPWAHLGRVGARGLNGLAVKCAWRKRRVMQGSELGWEVERHGRKKPMRWVLGREVEKSECQSTRANGFCSFGVRKHLYLKRTPEFPGTDPEPVHIREHGKCSVLAPK